MKIDLRQYGISEPRYIPSQEYWSVAHYLKTNRRLAFTARVPDKLRKASVDKSNAGFFESALVEKNDFH